MKNTDSMDNEVFNDLAATVLIWYDKLKKPPTDKQKLKLVKDLIGTIEYHCPEEKI